MQYFGKIMKFGPKTNLRILCFWHQNNPWFIIFVIVPNPCLAYGFNGNSPSFAFFSSKARSRKWVQKIKAANVSFLGRQLVQSLCVYMYHIGQLATTFTKSNKENHFISKRLKVPPHTFFVLACYMEESGQKRNQTWFL